MVTNYCYKDIDPKWDDVVGPKSGRKINECCGIHDPDDPTGGDCCYDTWQVQLKQVSQSYKAATEKSDQIKKRLVFITDRRDRYRIWVTELDKTEDKARQICHQLEIIATQSRKIWYNSCKAVQAIEILYCMVTDFFFQVDALRKKYDDLMTCVNNNHDPAVGKGTGILKYADEYLQKLEAVIKTRDDLVKPVLEAIHIANLIRNNISTKECPPPTPNPKPGGYEGYDPCNPKDEICPDCCDDKSRYYGFKAVICEWYKEFNCKVECEDPDPCLTEQQKQDRDRRIEQEAQKAAELRRANCN